MELPEEEHSDWPPSGFARNIQCAQSWHINRRSKGPVGDEALEGTGAHYVMEQCLKHDMMPYDYLGNIVDVKEGDRHVRVEVDKKFTEDLALAVNFIRECSKTAGLHGIEEKIRLDFIQKDFFGRCDLWHYSHDGVLTIADLKWGRIDISAKRVVQLIIYALGKAYELWQGGHQILQVRLVIIQPRSIVPGPRIKEDMMPGEELQHWEKVIRNTIAATQDPAAPFKTGDHCKFCAGLGLCPATTDLLHNATLAMGADWQTWTPVQISAILEAKTIMEQNIKRAENAAVRILMSGGTLPSGHQLYTSRKFDVWKDEEAVKNQLFATYGISALRAPTPNQAAELGDVGKRISTEFRFKPAGEPVLGRKGDNRAPYVAKSISDMFRLSVEQG